MRAYWSETKLNGEPLAPGVMCYIQDFTDEGMGKIPTYGKDKDEILDKVARTNGNAQRLLAQQRPAVQPTPKPSRLTAEQTMQAHADLDNPATAGRAIRQLVEDETGVSFDEIILNRFSKTCLQWEASHPDFYRHPANQKLIAEDAIRRAGGLKNVTAAHLEAAFTELSAAGYLVSEMNTQAPTHQSTEEPLNPSEEQASESSSPTPARTRTVAASGHRSTRFGSTAAPSWKPKYTREQIMQMPSAQSRKLIEANDKDYTDACEHFWPTRQQARA